MWLKYPLIILFFFCMALMQASFLPYFNVVGVVPNIVFIAFFIAIFFAKDSLYEGIFLAVTAGFFLDALAPVYFGTSIIALLLTYGVVAVIIHFVKERQETYVLTHFIVIFLVSLVCYHIFWHALSNIHQPVITFDIHLLIELGYNLIVAYVGFYLYAFFVLRQRNHRQLTLFR